MAQRLTYSIVDQPDGRFDILVLLGTRSLYARTGLMTLAEAEDEIKLIWALMAPFGASVIHWKDPIGLSHPCRTF